MLCKAAEAAKVPSALPMIHFMYTIVDSVGHNGCGAASNEVLLFGSSTTTMGWSRRIRTGPSKASID